MCSQQTTGIVIVKIFLITTINKNVLSTSLKLCIRSIKSGCLFICVLFIGMNQEGVCTTHHGAERTVFLLPPLCAADAVVIFDSLKFDPY